MEVETTCSIDQNNDNISAPSCDSPSHSSAGSACCLMSSGLATEWGWAGAEVNMLKCGGGRCREISTLCECTYIHVEDCGDQGHYIRSIWLCLEKS